MSENNYLYVEDDLLSREVMQTLLVDVIGVNSLTIFDDSSNFMDKLLALETLPNFVFLDIQVKPYNGHEMLSMLRNHKHTKHLKILAVSAGVMTNTVQQYKDEGFDGLISKPLDLMTFPEIIQRLESGETIWQIS